MNNSFWGEGFFADEFFADGYWALRTEPIVPVVGGDVGASWKLFNMIYFEEQEK